MRIFGGRISTGMVSSAVLLCAAALLTGCVTTRMGGGWRGVLARELPELGAQNWIVVADSAYPAHSAPGIETVATGGGHLDVLSTVLEAVNASPHVRASVYIDAEIRHVEEKYAPGISAYREDLSELLKESKVKIVALAHDNLVEKVNGTSDRLRVLVLKTDMVLPYSTAFVELHRGYFSEEGERALRNIIQPVRAAPAESAATPGK